MKKREHKKDWPAHQKMPIKQNKKPHKLLFILGGLAVLILLALLIFSAFGGSSMKTVQQGQTIKVHYEGKLEDGTVFDSSREREPLTFTVGAGQVIKGFDQAVLGMNVGDKKTITIPPGEAYGEWNRERLQELPKEKIPPEGLKEGATLLFKSEQGSFPVQVYEIKDTTVILDLNHPLAGKTLTFDIELVEIQE